MAHGRKLGTVTTHWHNNGAAALHLVKIHSGYDLPRMKYHAMYYWEVWDTVSDQVVGHS
jgi:hypothetical protein